MDQNPLKIPDYLKEMVHQVEETKSLVSAGGSVPRISLRGKKFRYILDGEEIRTENDTINVIILGVQPEHGMAKTYYKDGYQPGSSDPPDCSSQDGVTPDTWISTPVSPNCATCPMNAWGSATSMSGKKAKACKDSKRLMVVDPREIADGTIYVFNVTIASLKNLSMYGKYLVSNNAPMAAVLTKITMDDDSDFPMVSFAALGVLKEAQGRIAIERAAKKEWNEFEAAGPMLEAPEQIQKPALPAPAKTAEEQVAQTVENKPVEQAKPADTSETAKDPVDDLLEEW